MLLPRLLFLYSGNALALILHSISYYLERYIRLTHVMSVCKFLIDSVLFGLSVYLAMQLKISPFLRQ